MSKLTSPRFHGLIDPNAILSGVTTVKAGDSFITATVDSKGFLAYAYEPGCRQGQGPWNDFRLLGRGMEGVCINAAESYAVAGSLVVTH
jgi:hypothetical protein